MDPFLLPTNVQLSMLTHILLLITFAYASQSGFKKADPLPTEGTLTGFPTISSWNRSNELGYSGDSFASDTNDVIAALLDIGALENENDGNAPQYPTLDGLSSSGIPPRNQYSMKFVAYDIRLGKLEAVDSMSGSFSIQLQMFMQWQEWLTNKTETLVARNDCISFCDTTKSEVAASCCDKVWRPVLRFPNADIAQMDSVITKGRGLLFNFDFADCLQPLPQDDHYFTDARCFRQRFWELSLSTTCDASLNFRNFPLDSQQLSMDIRNPFSSRTWFQLAPGSLEARANNLIQKMHADALSAGWRIFDVTVSPLCDVASWKSTFFSIDTQLLSTSVKGNGSYSSQAQQIEQHLKSMNCPQLISWPLDLSKSQIDPRSMTAYNSIRQDYEERLKQTRNAYKQCVRENGSVYIQRTSDVSPTKIGWIDLNDSDFKGVSIPCLIDAVANLTTPGIRVSILVTRFKLYYLVKLIIPILVCVLFAFTAVAINVNDVGTRLAVVVPAAISLTALQILVVATDIPAISYIVPTTWLMLFSYIMILLICVESVIVRLISWKFQNSTSGSQKRAEGDPTTISPSTINTKEDSTTTKWRNAKNIDIALMCLLFVLYMIIVILCLVPPGKHKLSTEPGSISIWNP